MNDEPGSSSITIEVTTLDPQWLESLPGCPEIAQRAAAAAFDYLSGSPEEAAEGEVSLVLASDGQVRALNREYRKQDKATNVLSFPNMEDAGPEGGPRLLGDVVLARETLVQEAEAQDKEPADHLSHLVVHGVLHLLGYDHQDEEEAARMEYCEAGILTVLDVANPYADANCGIGSLDR